MWHLVLALVLGLALVAVAMATGVWPLVALLLFGGFLAWFAVRGPFRF